MTHDDTRRTGRFWTWCAAARSAWSLLTVLGGGGAVHPGAASWYGVVGVMLGAALGASWWVLHQALPPAVAAVVVVALDLVLTGMLHVDGLADCADGLLPPMERARRLVVMRTPDVGAFAVAVVAVVLMLRAASLASVSPQPILLIGLWSFSRGAMAATVALLPYARAGVGLPTAYGAVWPNRIGAATGLVLGVAALTLIGWRGVFAILGAAVAAITTARFARRRLGGYTGDVLGAIAVLSETVGLVAATARR